MRAILATALLVSCALQADARPAVVFESGGREVRIAVEVAGTPDLRERGLMGRAELAEDTGMLFVWDEDTATSFWMKDTLIPLSVAFVSAGGIVVRTLDMEPCRADPCPVYDPHVTYRMALEVREGTFARHGIGVGHRMRLVR